MIRECRQCRPGSILRCKTGPVVPAHMGDDPSLKHQTARGTASPTPSRRGASPRQKARLCPAWGKGTDTAALRLQALLFVLASGQQGRLPRGFFNPQEVFSPRFSLAIAIPAEVCASPTQNVRGVHKRGALRVYPPFTNPPRKFWVGLAPPSSGRKRGKNGEKRRISLGK